MQLLRENYQLFKPDTPFSNVRGYRNAYFEEVNSLTKRIKQYWNDAVRFKMQINGKYYYFINYSVFDENFDFLGGHIKVNRVISNFLSIMDFNGHYSIPVFKNTIPDKLKKIILKLEPNSSFLTNDFFKLLLNSELNPLKYCLEKEEISEFLTKFVNHYEIKDGWEYTEENGLVLTTTEDEVLESLREPVIVEQPNLESQFTEVFTDNSGLINGPAEGITVTIPNHDLLF